MSSHVKKGTMVTIKVEREPDLQATADRIEDALQILCRGMLRAYQQAQQKGLKIA